MTAWGGWWGGGGGRDFINTKYKPVQASSTATFAAPHSAIFTTGIQRTKQNKKTP